MIAPGTRAGRARRPLPIGLMPRRMKPVVPTKPWVRTATRLLALAEVASSPANMSAGIVNAEPEPAMTLMTPAMNPQPMSKKMCNGSTETWLQ